MTQRRSSFASSSSASVSKPSVSRSVRRRSLFGTLMAVSALSLVSAGCGQTEEPLIHNQGGSFAPLGFGEAQVHSDGTPSYLSGEMAATVRVSSATDAAKLLTHGALAASYRLAKESTLSVVSDGTDEQGNRFIKLAQQHAGMPVVGRQVVVQLGKDGLVEGVLGHLEPELTLKETVALSSAEAITKALASRGPGRAVAEPVLSVFIDRAGEAKLVYESRVDYQSAKGRQFVKMYVSAVDGQVLSEHSLVYTALNREIYDLKKVCLKDGSELPGTLLTKEGGTTTDAAGTRAYQHSGNVYWFYNKMFGRDSYDSKGSLIMSSIHGTFDTGMGCSGENAAWIPDPFNQMVYGDGGFLGLTLKDLTLGYDVAAHEMTHAVTSTTSDLEYLDESGALNEAMSDIMGAASEVWVSSGGSAAGNPATWTVSANAWKIGEDVAGLLFGSIGALRLMNDPTKDGMSKDYYPERNMPGSGDNGGVHTNSGIGNLAFYLLSAGGKHPRAKTTTEVKAIGIEKAARIFHLANTQLFTKTTTFQDARYATAKAAELLYGRCSTEWLNVHRAWDSVAVPGDWSLCVRPRGGF